MTTGAALALTGLALAACTAPAESGAEATPTVSEAPAASSTASASASPGDRPIGPVRLPEGATAAVEWVDETGAVEPQTVRLTGEPLYVTVSVVCDTADAEVTVEVEGLMTTGSSCVYDPGTTRTTSNGGGNTGSMEIAVDQDARITVTTDPADAHWSGAVSTGPRTVPLG
ncbi:MULTISPECIES: hypothetical protein [unclassified Rathayibacter]|uniref:hypothetical protein n=1 Tax=unclassified Rathayibacter TaxID=2609250 RepID=UPI0010E52A2A|nr:MULTISPECIES: hypothetical protein [unclassified Rathayibacter]TCL85908.1 hypothetical protein EDF49_101577 [Rathayibacter sp. PhB192]TCM31729.1 hypothetical protein EDF43_101577 [Rathayibacter sp. PhB179]